MNGEMLVTFEAANNSKKAANEHATVVLVGTLLSNTEACPFLFIPSRHHHVSLVLSNIRI